MERLGSMAGIEAEPAIASYLMDMDGVLVRGAQMIPGAVEFIFRLRARGVPFLILTNNSLYSPRDLQARLSRGGFDLPLQALYTPAPSPPPFFWRQNPRGPAHLTCEAGVSTAV